MEIDASVSDLDLAISVSQCSPNTPISKVRKVLQESKIGSIVVTEDEEVRGIFTERDYLMKIAGRESDLDSRPVSDFMTPNPKSVTDSELILRVIEMMNGGRFRHMIVKDKEGKLVGVISVRDLMVYLSENIKTLQLALKDLASVLV